MTDAGPTDHSRFTGERPGWGAGFDYDFSRHLAAYEYAATLVAGRRVLDAGCGEGFGTQNLAAAATEVVGIDYSQEAVDTCRRLWCDGSRPNLRFERVDLTRAAEDSRHFDVVLSFQVIEHIAEPRPFLRALAQRLAPGGILVLTTPNRLRSASENPFHLREYVRSELHDELSALFGEVTIAGIHGNEKVERFERRRADAVRSILRLDPLGIRRLLPKSAVEFAFARLARLVRRRAQPHGEEEIKPADFFVNQSADETALDLLAVCSNARR